MNKSGQQGLSFVKQQKVLAAIKRKRKLEPIFMIDVNSIWVRRKDGLTHEQCKKIDDWLEEKEGLIVKRSYNKGLVKTARETEVPPEKREEQCKYIDDGVVLIAKHTRRISALSINAIAIRLKLPYLKVEYYANKQKYDK